MVLTLQAVYIASAEIYCRDGTEVRRPGMAEEVEGGGGQRFRWEATI